MKKKILSIILTLSILCAFMPVIAIAATSGTCGDNVTWTLDDSGTLAISGTGAMKDYYSSSDSPFYNNSNIKSVAIENGVTSIGNFAFYGCSGLTGIKIPDSVTRIGEHAFDGCEGLTSVTIPDSVTSIGNGAFRYCSSLTEIKIPNGVTSINSSTFAICSGLISVTIPDNITNIGSQAFIRCNKLTSITIPDSVTSIGYEAFYNCGLKNISIGSGITNISEKAFYNCSSLTDVYYNGKLNDFFEISIEKNNSNFMNTKLHCTDTTVVNWGKYGENIRCILDDNGTLTISGTGDMTDYYDYSSSPFYNNSNIKSIIIENDVTSIGNYAFSHCDNLTSVTIGNSVTRIGTEAFSYCDNLTSVTIPNSVTNIDNWAFGGCNSLDSVYISDITAYLNINFGNVRSNPMYYANKLYLNNKRITGELQIPDGVTKIPEYTFKNCSGLTSVTIPDSVTSIGDYAFYDCGGLASITIPDSVTNIGDFSFRNCSGLTSITILDSVISIGDYAFSGCSGLTNVKIGNNVTSMGDSAFSGCSGLTSITIPDSVINIGDYAFSYCSGLTSVTIGNGITNIRNHTFDGCGSLTSVRIPKNVTEIETDVFNGCYYLKTVEYGGSKEDWDNLYIGGGNDYLKNATINYNSSYWDIAKFQYRIDTAKKGVFITGFDKSETEANIPSTIENLPVIGIDENAFSGCKITKVTIPNSIASIGNNAFANCSSLNDVYISDLEKWCKIDFSNANSNPMSVASNLYLNNELVTALTIPNSITNIKDYTFYGCKSITGVTIPNSITAIGKDAFCGCNALNNVYISDIEKWCKINFNNVNSNPMSCANNLYINNTLTTELTIPNTVTSISDYAFYGCKSLTSVTISNSIKSIGNNAFNQCTNLKDIYYMGSLTIGTNNEPFTNANLHLIGGGVESTPTPTPTAEPTLTPTPTPTVTPTAKPTPTVKPTQTPIPSGGYPYVINELSLKTTSGDILSKAPANTGFIVNTKFTKIEKRAETDYIFVAVYDTKGALLSLNYVQANFAENYTYDVGFYIPPQKEDVGSIKAFVWNTFSSMTPLAESKEL